MAVTGACELYLVRHALTLWNKQKRYLGHTDQEVVLEETWRLEPLRKSIEQIQFNRIYCSDLVRCQQTLQMIYPSCDKVICLDPALMEIHFGKWEGQTYEELKDDLTYRAWLENPMQFAPLDGETLRQFQERVNLFIDSLLNQVICNEWQNRNESNRSILVVTHGGVIRQFLSSLVSGRSFWEWDIPNGSAIKLRLTRQKEVWECNSWSEVLIQENGESLEKE